MHLLFALIVLLIFLNIRPYNFRFEAILSQSSKNLLLVLASERFKCDTKLNGSVSVDRNKLVVLKFDNVSVYSGNNTGNS